MIKKIYLILFAIAMVATLYYNGLNVQIAKYISMAIYGFLFVMAVVKSTKEKMPILFKSWLFWLMLAGFINLAMLPNVRSIYPILNMDISMPLMVAFSSYYLFDINREKLAYYMLPVCVVAAYLAVISVLSGLGGFMIDEYYKADVAKNQVGAAFTSMAIICLVFLLELNSSIFKIGFGALSIICLYPAVFFACRAALLSYFAVAAFLLYRDYRLKGLILLGLFIGAYVLFAPDSLDAILYDSVVGHRDTDDLDDLSSGRLSIATESLEYFLNHPLLGFYGSGDSYTASYKNAHIFLLYRWAKWGLIGAIPFVALYFSIFKILVRSFRVKDLLLAGTLLLAYIESFAEYAPPFGPGSCFIVTFVLLGYSLKRRKELL